MQRVIAQPARQRVAAPTAIDQVGPAKTLGEIAIPAEIEAVIAGKFRIHQATVIRPARSLQHIDQPRDIDGKTGDGIVIQIAATDLDGITDQFDRPVGQPAPRTAFETRPGQKIIVVAPLHGIPLKHVGIAIDPTQDLTIAVGGENVAIAGREDQSGDQLTLIETCMDSVIGSCNRHRAKLTLWQTPPSPPHRRAAL